jgi:hypothetical protein
VIEALLTGVLGSGAIAATITGIVHVFITRSNYRRKISSAPEPVKAVATLSQAMRDEIEQNEAWWLRSFHALLLEVQTPVLARIPGREYDQVETWRGEFISMKSPDRVALEGCICPECAKVVKEAERIPDTSEISFDNPALVAEIQRAYGLVADGVVGVKTIRAIETRRPSRPMSIEAWSLIDAYLEFVAEQARRPILSSKQERVDWDAEVRYWMELDRRHKKWA